MSHLLLFVVLCACVLLSSVASAVSVWDDDYVSPDECHDGTYPLDNICVPYTTKEVSRKFRDKISIIIGNFKQDIEAMIVEQRLSDAIDFVEYIRDVVANDLTDPKRKYLYDLFNRYINELATRE